MQLNKLKSAVKTKTAITLNITRKMFEGDVLLELLLTTKQKSKLRNVFSNQLAIDKNFQIMQLGGFLGALLSKLVAFIEKIAALLAKSILLPLGLIAAASAGDAGIEKKILGLEPER